MKKFLAIITITTLSAIFALSAAADTPAYSLRGAYLADQVGYFDYNVTPGSTIKDGILVSNLDPDRTITVGVGISGTANENVVPVDGIISGIPLYWLSLPDNKVQIEPESSKIVNFEIEIPADAQIATYETVMSGRLVASSDETKQSGAVGVMLAVGKKLNLFITEGEPTNIDRTFEIETPEEESKESQKSGEGLGTEIYNFLQERFEIILIFAILLLILKLIVEKNRKKE